MTIKKIILFASILIAAVALTVVVLVLLKVPGQKAQTQVQIPARGYQPTDETVLRTVEGVTALPSVISYPNTDGWVVKSADTETKPSSISLENAKCSLKVNSLGTPFIETKLKDYGLSKAYTQTVAAGEEGMLSDAYIITVPTTQGDADFYSALYHPKVEFVGPSAATASLTTKASLMPLDGDYTTFIAVRLVATPIGSSTEKASGKEGTVGLTQTIPAVVMKYRCLTTDFNVDVAIDVIKKLTIDFTATNHTVTAPSTAGSSK